MKKRILIPLLASILTVVFICAEQSNAWASQIEILPASYSFDKLTDCGSYCYDDETGIQLIDGDYGVDLWNANLGNGPAYEWVGWKNDTPVNIDFDFGTSTQVDSIHVGSVQDSAWVILPSIEILSSQDKVSWESITSLFVPKSTANNYKHKTFIFDNLAIHDQYIRISLTHSLDWPWAFTDEVDFYTNLAPVPVPSAIWLFASGIIALTGINRGSRKKI